MEEFLGLPRAAGKDFGGRPIFLGLPWKLLARVSVGILPAHKVRRAEAEKLPAFFVCWHFGRDMKYQRYGESLETPRFHVPVGRMARPRMTRRPSTNFPSEGPPRLALYGLPAGSWVRFVVADSI